MSKKQLVAVLAMGVLINLEFLALLFLIYFARLPLIIFLITVVFQLLSFSLIGIATLFLILIIFGINPGLTVESWLAHLKESVRLFGISLLITFLMLAVSAIIGGLTVLLLRRIYLFQWVGYIMERTREWIGSHFY